MDIQISRGGLSFLVACSLGLYSYRSLDQGERDDRPLSSLDHCDFFNKKFLSPNSH